MKFNGPIILTSNASMRVVYDRIDDTELYHFEEIYRDKMGNPYWYNNRTINMNTWETTGNSVLGANRVKLLLETIKNYVLSNEI